MFSYKKPVNILTSSKCEDTTFSDFLDYISQTLTNEYTSGTITKSNPTGKINNCYRIRSDITVSSTTFVGSSYSSHSHLITFPKTSSFFISLFLRQLIGMTVGSIDASEYGYGWKMPTERVYCKISFSNFEFKVLCERTSTFSTSTYLFTYTNKFSFTITVGGVDVWTSSDATINGNWRFIGLSVTDSVFASIGNTTITESDHFDIEESIDYPKIEFHVTTGVTGGRVGAGSAPPISPYCYTDIDCLCFSNKRMDMPSLFNSGNGVEL